METKFNKELFILWVAQCSIFCSNFWINLIWVAFTNHLKPLKKITCQSADDKKRTNKIRATPNWIFNVWILLVIRTKRLDKIYWICLKVKKDDTTRTQLSKEESWKKKYSKSKYRIGKVKLCVIYKIQPPHPKQVLRKIEWKKEEEKLQLLQTTS